MSIFEQVATQQVSERLGGASPLSGLLGGGAATIGLGMIKSGLPRGLGPVVDIVNNVAGDLQKGDWRGAAEKAINSGVFTAKLPWLDNAHSVIQFARQESRAMGGVTPLQARRMMEESLATHFARKNLFMVSIKNPKAKIDAVDPQYGAEGGPYNLLNLFVVDVSYGPITITADAHKIGSAVLDQPNGTEAIEMRLTTMDNEKGSIRRWFSQLAGQVTNTDGTFGVPADYLLQIEILHSFVTEESKAHWLSKSGGKGWSQKSWFRPVSLESDLSRKDDALEEFTMVFHQFDTYYR